MKTYKLLTLSFLLGTAVNAQTLADARKNTENERFDVAGGNFRALIAKEPTKAENYFYYGENFLEHGDLDSANIIWTKGVAVDPLNALNYTGLGKYLWFQGDTTAANVHIAKAFTLTKNKNAEIMRQTANIFIRTTKFKKLKAALELLDKALKLDPNNPENYLLMGDALLQITPENSSPAIKNYNLALNLDPKSPKALVRTAKIYFAAKNPELANSKYEEAQALDPNYAPAYRENAELYMRYDKSTKAIENWKKYLALNNSIEARYRYATSLFQGKKYCDAIGELTSVQAGGFNNFYVERMLTYSYYECTENDVKASYAKGLETSAKFFQMVPKDKVLASDYKYKGYLLSKSGNDSLAILELETAATIDPTVAGELYGEIGKMQMKAKKYSNVITAYEKKRNGVYTNLTLNELYDLGRSYYFGPKDYALADSCYANFLMRSPTYALAHLGRARCQMKLNPVKENWSSKDHYIKFIELLKPEEVTAANNKSNVMEASKYLGDYFVNSTGKDNEKAKYYWNIVKTLDPADKQAAQFFASPAGK